MIDKQMGKRVIACGYVFAICIGNVFSQLSAGGDLRQYIENKISGLPKSGANDYFNPDEAEKVTWRGAMELILNGDTEGAHSMLSGVGYRVVLFRHTENEKVYYVVEKEIASTNYWGLYVINPNACRSNLIIQSPHPTYDTNTGKQGIYTFIELEARSFFLSGTHRCNSGTESSCSGTTAVCGASGPYRISDPAHNAEGMFQLMTAFLLERDASSIFIQFHGFGKQTGDPNAILSNGTRITPQKDYMGDLIAEMHADHPGLTFKSAHLDLSWDRLLAFTNTQGRLINGSAAPCSTGATSANGQFIHIEQELSAFRSDESGWAKWIAPMERVFPCEAEQPLGVVDVANLRVFPNPFSRYVSFTGTGIKSLLIYDTSGRTLLKTTPQSWKHIDLSTIGKGVFIYQILDESGALRYSGKLVHQ